MWTYDELVATAYVFYGRVLTTKTIAGLLATFDDKIVNHVMDKLVNKVTPDDSCYLMLAPEFNLEDLEDLVNPEILKSLINRANIPYGEYLEKILGIRDKELRDLLLEKFTCLIDFRNINLRQLDEQEHDKYKVRVKK